MRVTWHCCLIPIATESTEVSTAEAIATWLVARPLNAALALAATVSAQLFSPLSGAILVLLVLSKGPRGSLLDVALAMPFVVVIGLIYGQAPKESVLVAAQFWLAMWLLAAVLTKVRSLTLTIQLSVIAAVAILSAVFLIFGNPVEYWVERITALGEQMRAAEEPLLQAFIDRMKGMADQMTMIAVYQNWLMLTIGLALGYKLFRAMPGVKPVFGRFRDLNLGKVLALVLVVVSIGWMVTDAVFLQSVAFVMLGAFWLQGLAIVHWLYGEGMMPKFGIVLTYVMLLSVVLTAVTVTGLAIFGYLDAWFRLRRRATIDE